MTVVVPTRDRAERLHACLRSVRAALRADDELIVVDSASIDAAAVAAAASEFGGVLLRCDRPGVDLARNAGWRAGRNDVVLFTDDDVVVAPSWADELASAVVANVDAGFVTGRVLASAAELEAASAATTDPMPAGATRSGRWARDVAVKRDPEPEVYDGRSVGNLGHGASLGIRRTVLEQLGGWDELLGVGALLRSAPEADLFDRCFAAGMSGRYEPRALAWHEQWRGPRRVILLDARYGFGNGARIAKLLRTDRRRGWLVARHSAWSWGLADVGRGVKWRDLSRVMAATVRLVATVAGFACGLSVPIVDGHFTKRSR